MAINSAANIDLIKQGVYNVPVKTLIEDNKFSFGRNVLFGKASVSSNLDYLVMDYKSRGIPLSDEALKGADPNRVNYGTGFNEKAIFGLYFNNEDQVACDQAENRVSMDEPLDAPWDYNTRMAYLLAEKRDRIILSHDQSFEKACWDTILNGQFTAKNGGVQSFPMTSSFLSVSGANMSTKPMETILAGAKKVLQKSGAKITQLILNPDDAAKILQASAFQGILETRRQYENEVRYKAMEENGAGFCGYINAPGVGTIEVIAYFGGYDLNGTWTYFLPSGKAVLAPAAVGAKGYCGVYVNDGMFTGKTAVEHGVHIWALEGALPHTTHVQVQSAPCPMLTEIDRYCVFTSVA